ncbi:MAG: efflux RND transporter permease subunit, partial [Planctomycetota bacterium JB042]
CLVVFEVDVDFYWSRSRLLEKLNSLPAGTLPDGVRPSLGPDATPLGQVFWYTLEGRDQDGAPAPGFSLAELRSTQDWLVRYALQGADGVSEVGSIGGFVREYQVDVDPDAMRAYGVTLGEVFDAVRRSNVDVSARTIELNRVEYVVRGLGFLRSVEDLERTVVKSRDGVPVYVSNVAHVTLGPALRRGALDKDGAEAVGGVVVVRFGANPLEVIENVKAKIAEIAPGLPETTLEDGRRVKMTIVPFYDRTGLILETLDTLNDAILQQVLVTIVVVLVMVMHLRSSILISALLPITVLLTFLGMKAFSVDANIVALSGIAIAVGTIVDMGIVLSENMLRHLDERTAGGRRLTYREALSVLREAAAEVGGAVVTAIATTVVSFLPVFTMTGAEGKLFSPLAWTKTLALLASVAVALTMIPPAAHLLLAGRVPGRTLRALLLGAVVLLGLVLGATVGWPVGATVAVLALYGLASPRLPARLRRALVVSTNLVLALAVAVALAATWEPLGPEAGLLPNAGFVVAIVGGLLLFFRLFQLAYEPLLRLFLRMKLLFLLVPVALVVTGATVWLGFDRVFRFLPEPAAKSDVAVWARHAFPGLGKEFMPPLDEGSFLYMPTTMPHASIGEAMDVLRKQGLAFRAIPEIESAVGKIGRVDSALDPAPISMIETIIQYVPEYAVDEDGNRVRRWRDEIETPRDIWREIERAGAIPGTTGASYLQPIEARRVMLQTGMRSNLGLKVVGPDLATIERVAVDIEAILKEVPVVEPATVLADRVVGKPYLEIEIDREAIARYGVPIRAVQDVIEVAVGGRPVTTTVEGRERYPVRVRYQRELRDSYEALARILVPVDEAVQIPLSQLASIRYVRGPQMIRSEETFLTAFVTFGQRAGVPEVDAVETCRAALDAAVADGRLEIPPGVSYRFAGAWENQVRAQKTLAAVLPVALFLILLILYLHFRSLTSAAIVFSGVAVAWAGGFLLLWAYGRPGFLDVEVLGVHLGELFQVQPVNLSVAVWVGFLALFGIATDDGVVISTYLKQSFERNAPATRREIREAVVEAGKKRIRPCLMTTATTLLALLPVLTSTGRGADVMVPMAIPSFGGMAIELLTLFVVPVLYCGSMEARLLGRRLVSADAPPATKENER